MHERGYLGSQTWLDTQMLIPQGKHVRNSLGTNIDTSLGSHLGTCVGMQKGTDFRSHMLSIHRMFHGTVMAMQV